MNMKQTLAELKKNWTLKNKVGSGKVGQSWLIPVVSVLGRQRSGGQRLKVSPEQKCLASMRPRVQNHVSTCDLDTWVGDRPVLHKEMLFQKLK
jgi:hypothetical protein